MFIRNNGLFVNLLAVFVVTVILCGTRGYQLAVIVTLTTLSRRFYSKQTS